MLETADIAALNAETENITAAIDDMVIATTFNSKSLLATSEVTFNVGVSDEGNISNNIYWYN